MYLSLQRAELGSSSSAGDDTSNHSWSYIPCHIHRGQPCAVLDFPFNQMPSNFRTLIVLLFCTDSHVSRQSFFATKCLPTFRTLIVLFFCMDNHVSCHTTLKMKCFPTFRTLIVLFLCMDNHALFQISHTTKCPPTFRILFCSCDHPPWITIRH